MVKPSRPENQPSRISAGRSESELEIDRSSALASRSVMSGGSGGGETPSDLERRVISLERGLEKIDNKLDSIIKSVDAGRVENEKRYSDTNVRLAEFNGKISNVHTLLDGMKRELDRLPSKHDVTISIFAVISGIAACVTAGRLIWSFLSGS